MGYAVKDLVSARKDARLAALREVREMCVALFEPDPAENWGVVELAKRIDAMIAKEER